MITLNAMILRRKETRTYAEWCQRGSNLGNKLFKNSSFDLYRFMMTTSPRKIRPMHMKGASFCVIYFVYTKCMNFG